MTARFDLLKPFIEQFSRPLSILDIGAGIEEYQRVGEAIARHYTNACCVSIEKDYSPEKFPPSLRSIVLKKHFSADDLVRLAECEHFDVVLALNILHWFTTPAEAFKALSAIHSLGDHVFIQLPYPDEEAMNQGVTQALGMYLQDAMIVGETSQFPGHRPRPLYKLAHKRTLLTRTHWDAHDDSAATDFGYDASYGKPVRATLKSGKIVPWIPGMNLYNWFKLGGVVPDRERMIEMLRTFQLPEPNHGDVTLHNFVLSGDRLYLIDGFDGWHPANNDKENLQKIVEAL
jgi:SAM-dependent methyltransferase